MNESRDCCCVGATIQRAMNAGGWRAYDTRFCVACFINLPVLTCFFIPTVCDVCRFVYASFGYIDMYYIFGYDACVLAAMR